MMLDYQKVWKSMNDLEQVMNKICNIMEILDSSTEAIENHKYKKAEALNYAVYQYLEMVLGEFDDKFKIAWNETVKKTNNLPIERWEIPIKVNDLNDSFYFDLPKELCDSVGFKEGDIVNWELHPGQEDTWILKKINTTYSE